MYSYIHMYVSMPMYLMHVTVKLLSGSPLERNANTFLMRFWVKHSFAVEIFDHFFKTFCPIFVFFFEYLRNLFDNCRARVEDFGWIRVTLANIVDCVFNFLAFGLGQVGIVDSLQSQQRRCYVRTLTYYMLHCQPDLTCSLGRTVLPIPSVRICEAFPINIGNGGLVE